MSEYEQNCIDLNSFHGNLVKMECIHPWSREEFANATTPFRLSGWYRLTYEDGAEVEVASIFAYSLAQGDFGFIIDSTNKVQNCIYVRDDRALAYICQMGASLAREKEGLCKIPSQDEAECIIDGFDIPFEALKYGSESACKNLQRWVGEWSQRGLIRWDEENHEWHIVRKSLNEKQKCWAVKQVLNATPKSLSFDGKEFVVVDAKFGKVKRISVEPEVDVLLAPRNPMKMETVLTVEYENGIEHPDFFPWETLALGWVRCHANDGSAAGFLCNKQVVAAVGRAIANLEPFLDGDIVIPGEKEADEIIKRLDIPYPPISYAEAGMIRPCIKIDLMKRWKKSGKLCQMKDGSYEIEKLPSLHNQERDAQIAKSGEEVARETIESERYDSLFAIGAAKQKKSKMKKKPKMRRWPKNKAEHRENQMRLWGGEEGLKGFETREMKTSSGKTCTYYVKIDPTGRMRIADTGEDAPAGYYSQSAKYYALLRNVRVARRWSSKGQQALWFACIEKFKSTSGFLVQLGNRGLVRMIDGKYAEMNFGKTISGRKFIDSTKDYYPEVGIEVDGMRLKKPKYTMIIE